MIKWGDIELPGFDGPCAPVGMKRRKIFADFLENLIAVFPRPRTKRRRVGKPKRRLLRVPRAEGRSQQGRQLTPILTKPPLQEPGRGIRA